MEFERKLDAKLILSILAAGIMSFSGVVVETAMNVTFPTLMAEFQVGTATVQWITTGYLLVLAMIIPASSWLKRRFPAKKLFLTAISLFLAGTVLAAAAPAFFWLLLGRLIQGVGTGIALPMMFNIVLEQVPYPKMGFMMGIASLITAVAPAVGPSLGGMIVSRYGWRMIFVTLLPLLVVSFVLGAANIRQVTPTEKIPFQGRDYLLLAVGFVSLIFGINRASQNGWLCVSVIVLLLVGFGALLGFYFQSKKTKEPLIRVQVFHTAAFSLSVAVVMLIQFVCLAIGFLIPNYAQLTLGKDAFVAGCLLLPGCNLGAVVSPLSGRVLDRFGAKLPILLGNGAVVISAVCFSLFLKQAGVFLILLFYVFFAFGQGFSMGTSMTNGLKQLPGELGSDGNAVFNTLQQLAGAVGTSGASTIVAAAQGGASDLQTGTLVGTQTAFMVLLLLAVAMFGCSCQVFRIIRKNRTSNYL